MSNCIDASLKANPAITSGRIKKGAPFRELKNALPAFSIETYRHHPSFAWTYEKLDQKQRSISAQIQQGDSGGVLLVSELAPVITLGRRTPACDLLLSEDERQISGVGVYPTDRGGLATYHGTGQWVLFPVDRLDRLTGDRRGVRKAVETLLEVALQVGRKYDPNAEILSGNQLGVWTSQGKFASVGVYIENGILLHGLSVNGFQTPLSFKGIRPCGMEPQVSYLLPELPVLDLEREFLILRDRLIAETLTRFWKK